MTLIRTYFSKDAVIVKNSCANTGANPVAELFHGGSPNANSVIYSRYLFDVDLTDLTEKIGDKELFVDRLTHKINITNTNCFDKQLYCKDVCSSVGSVKRATSFDLVLFKIPDAWDEGNGYDYVQPKNLVFDVDNNTFCEGAVNWKDRRTNTPWTIEGTYSGDPTSIVIATQSFDKGNENICFDVTDYINGVLTGDTNYGLGIAYQYSLEQAGSNDVYYTGFFGKETNTVYEPYLQSTHSDTISDDRTRFFLNKENRLYLYTNAGGEAVNATLSGVTITDDLGKPLLRFGPDEIQQSGVGTYYVDVQFPQHITSGYCDNVLFQDIWSGVTIGDVNLGDVSLDFQILGNDGYYTVGAEGVASARGIGVNTNLSVSIYDYSFSVRGIKQQEKIKCGDTRKIYVDAKVPLSIDTNDVIERIEYRVYIKEGLSQLDYIDWSPVNRTVDGNFVIIDTSWFIPNDYYLEVKISSGSEVRVYEKPIKFEIVSEKDWC